MHIRGLRQELLQIVPPEGAHEDAHRRAPLRVQLEGLRKEVLPFRRAVAPQKDSHRREKVQVRGLSEGFHAVRPPGQAHEEAREGETELGAQGGPGARPAQAPAAGATGGRVDVKAVLRLIIAHCTFRVR